MSEIGSGEFSSVESLSDEQLLAQCHLSFHSADQEVLSALLGKLREGILLNADCDRLDQLMAAYRRGTILKARAWKEAVHRGLKPNLIDDCASLGSEQG